MATGVRLAGVRTSPWGPLKSTRTATQRRECGFVNFHDIFFSCFPYTLMQLVCTSVIPESFASIHSQSCISVFMFDCILTIVSQERGIKTKLRWPTVERALFFERHEFLQMKGQSIEKLVMRVQVTLLSFVQTCSFLFSLMVKVWILKHTSCFFFFFVLIIIQITQLYFIIIIIHAIILLER